MVRQCARPTCSAPADTTLSFDYSSRVVWLDPLLDDPHPARHDLCNLHARRTSVPNGWRLENRLETEQGSSLPPPPPPPPASASAQLVDSQGC